MKYSALEVFVLLAPASAWSQTFYVGGAAFADLRRPSGNSDSGNPDTKLDVTTAGLGVRVGAFLAPRWTVELAVDVGANQSSPLVLGPIEQIGSNGAILIPSLSGQTSSRVTATSVLVGYHPPGRGRLRPGFRGGLSFLHTGTTTTETVTYSFLNNIVPPFPVSIPPPTTTHRAMVTNEMAPLVAGEVAVALTRHVAVVPEARALGASMRYVIRPGASVRWTW